jgi:hypothetical protein
MSMFDLVPIESLTFLCRRVHCKVASSLKNRFVVRIYLCDIIILLCCDVVCACTL